MKHFIDKISTIGNHRIEAGVIVDSKGQQVGRVAIRYTKSNMGQNKEAGISLNHEVKPSVHYSTTVKSDSFGTPLYDLISLHDLKPINLHGDAVNAVSEDCRNIGGFKVGNSVYKILWAV